MSVKIITLFVAIFCSVLLIGQSIDRQVIASGGDYFSNPAVGSIGLTVGEIMTETFQDEFLLTQGFQQGDLIFQDPTSIKPINEDKDFMVYPNPTEGKIFFQWKNVIPASYTVLDQAGRIISINELDLSFNELDLSGYADGTYFLLITDVEKNKYAVEIIKMGY